MYTHACTFESDKKERRREGEREGIVCFLSLALIFRPFLPLSLSLLFSSLLCRPPQLSTGSQSHLLAHSEGFALLDSAPSQAHLSRGLGLALLLSFSPSLSLSPLLSSLPHSHPLPCAMSRALSMLGAFGGVMVLGYGLMYAITPTDEQLLAVRRASFLLTLKSSVVAKRVPCAVNRT